MNKMTEVLELLGLEFNREFLAHSDIGETFRCRINDKGIWCYHSINEFWYKANNILYGLITGEYKIEKKPWKAELNEEYYMPFPASPDRYNLMTNNGSKTDNDWYEKGLMCKTKEQAIETAEAMINVARAMQGVGNENF